MKQFKKRKGNAILLGVLVFVFVFSAFTPALDAGVCERALHKCAVDAAIAGVTGGVITGLAWGSVCMAGYDWCLRYYVN